MEAASRWRGGAVEAHPRRLGALAAWRRQSCVGAAWGLRYGGVGAARRRRGGGVERRGGGVEAALRLTRSAGAWTLRGGGVEAAWVQSGGGVGQAYSGLGQA